MRYLHFQTKTHSTSPVGMTGYNGPKLQLELDTRESLQTARAVLLSINQYFLRACPDLSRLQDNGAGTTELTQTSRAGMGVQYFTWIMASKLGKWPSRAPEKHNLQIRIGALIHCM